MAKKSQSRSSSQSSSQSSRSPVKAIKDRVHMPRALSNMSQGQMWAAAGGIAGIALLGTAGYFAVTRREQIKSFAVNMMEKFRNFQESQGGLLSSTKDQNLASDSEEIGGRGYQSKTTGSQVERPDYL